MSESEPQWHLLPHSPAEFFELAEGFTLQDLRRAYSQLIKRYKPEAYPAEFQRIRAAYDILSQQLRYGEPPPKRSAAGGFEFDWQSLTSSTSDLHGDTRPPRSASSRPPETASDSALDGESQSPPRSAEQPSETESRHQETVPPDPVDADAKSTLGPLTIENAEAHYEELGEREGKTPYDYYILAVLSDVVNPDPHSFILHLLEGIAAFDDDVGLTRLVQAYFSNVDMVAEALTFARLTSEHVRSDTYYCLTESLWLRVLREAKFEVFLRELEACEGNLLDHRSHHQMVFYLRLLRSAVWRTDNDWPEEKLKLIGALGGELAHWAEAELYFLDQLLIYRTHRKLFLRLGAMAVRIDQAIVDYCTSDELEADRKFIECQVILAARPDDLMHEFPVPTPHSIGVEYVWEGIAREVLDRHEVQSIAASPETLQRKVEALAFYISDEGDRHGFKVWGHFYVLGLLGVLLADFALIVYSGYRIFVDVFFEGQFLDALLLFLLASAILILSIIPLWICGAESGWLVFRYYRYLWRRPVLNFFESGRFQVRDVVAGLLQLEEQKVEDKKLEGMKEISKAVASDRALIFYATAQRVLKSIDDSD